MSPIHSFQIPIMGTGFTVDTPAKVAPYGIDSVISLCDHILIEKMRERYCRLMGETYKPIDKNGEDARAQMITAYLNIIDRYVKKRFIEIKESSFTPQSEATKYFDMIDDLSPLKKSYQDILQTKDLHHQKVLQEKLKNKMRPGLINVNIMTKLDSPNYTKDKKELPVEFSDGMSALRGYAKSTLESSIVFSAGINPRLYQYVEQFQDFFANKMGYIKKKIILKVSDFRSALIQGKYFAKRGIWVSEFRVESGLNCGGHAFATNGRLMGPILEEFKTKRKELIDQLFKLFSEALTKRKRVIPQEAPPVCFSAQGGIGTPQEHRFLRRHYSLGPLGWGTPFLLVPEATNVGTKTREKLSAAKEEDLYVSDASPLNVPFNNLRNSESERSITERFKKNKPGSPCLRGYLVSNKEFTDKLICTASSFYQTQKIRQLKAQNLTKEAYDREVQKFQTKACLCMDLGVGAIENEDKRKSNSPHTEAVCPGPNIAYFSKIASLREMLSHIYGRLNLLNGIPRPHMFIKELKLYVDYFYKEIKKHAQTPSEKQAQFLREFIQNLFDSIDYYKNLFPNIEEETREYRKSLVKELHRFKENLEDIVSHHTELFLTPQPVS